jgi:hypothetical protein
MDRLIVRRDEKGIHNFSRGSYSAYTTQQDNIKTHHKQTDFQSIDRILNKHVAWVLPIKISWSSLVGMSTAYLRYLYGIFITIATILS